MPTKHDQKAHNCRQTNDTMGHADAILMGQTTGVRQGGTDPRGDGAAVAC